MTKVTREEVIEVLRRFERQIEKLSDYDFHMFINRKEVEKAKLEFHGDKRGYKVTFQVI